MNIIMRRIPMTALQTGLFRLLSNGQTTPVYDDIPASATMPYVQIGAFTSKNVSDKTTDIWDCSIQIHMFSDYQGKAELNEIANDVTTVLSSARIDLSADNFSVISQEVDYFETWPEQDLGYSAVITLLCKIQNLGA